MRRIMYGIDLDKETYSPYLVIKLRDEEGNINVLFREEFRTTDSKYTPEQQAKINQINNLLEMNGGHPLSEDEADWMLDPAHFKAYLNEKLDEEELQRLAGFKVEKKITYFDDMHPGNE